MKFLMWVYLNLWANYKLLKLFLSEQETDSLLSLCDCCVKIKILPSMSFNAYCRPYERTVEINQGLINTCTMFQLKGVLAHELGHMFHEEGPSYITELAADQFAQHLGLENNLIAALGVIEGIEHTNLTGYTYSIHPNTAYRKHLLEDYHE